jgi:uncharacterized protein YndB with AHSA1/START domain
METIQQSKQAAKPDDSILRVKRESFASPELLYRAFTEDALLRQWWDGDSACDARVGGHYAWGRKFQDGKIYYAQGEILDLEAGKRLEIDFAWSDTPAEKSRCTLHFEEGRMGMGVVRIEHDLSVVGNACESGWTSILDRLTRVDLIDQASYDWSRFEKRLKLKVPAAEILPRWNTAEGLKSWFLKEAVYTSVDGSVVPVATEGCAFEWEWSQGDKLKGEVISTGPSHFEFSFGTPIDGKTGEKLETVRVRVESVEVNDRQSVLALTQSRMPLTDRAKAGWHLDCSVGWTDHLLHLKALLEYGVDIRDAWERSC